MPPAITSRARQFWLSCRKPTFLRLNYLCICSEKAKNAMHTHTQDGTDDHLARSANTFALMPALPRKINKWGSEKRTCDTKGWRKIHCTIFAFSVKCGAHNKKQWQCSAEHRRWTRTSAASISYREPVFVFRSHLTQATPHLRHDKGDESVGETINFQYS